MGPLTPTTRCVTPRAKCRTQPAKRATLPPEYETSANDGHQMVVDSQKLVADPVRLDAPRSDLSGYAGILNDKSVGSIRGYILTLGHGREAKEELDLFRRLFPDESREWTQQDLKQAIKDEIRNHNSLPAGKTSSERTHYNTLRKHYSSWISWAGCKYAESEDTRGRHIDYLAKQGETLMKLGAHQLMATATGTPTLQALKQGASTIRRESGRWHFELYPSASAVIDKGMPKLEEQIAMACNDLTLKGRETLLGLKSNAGKIDDAQALVAEMEAALQPDSNEAGSATYSRQEESLQNVYFCLHMQIARSVLNTRQAGDAGKSELLESIVAKVQAGPDRGLADQLVHFARPYDDLRKKFETAKQSKETPREEFQACKSELKALQNRGGFWDLPSDLKSDFELLRKAIKREIQERSDAAGKSVKTGI